MKKNVDGSVTMNSPYKAAHTLASKMREFREASELRITSETNVCAPDQMVELIKQINWKEFGSVIEQLEFMFNQQQKKRK